MKTKNLTTYPIIDDRLIEVLQIDFPDKLPRQQLNDFELGKLVGHQELIDKLIFEQKYTRKEITDDEEEDFIDSDE